jgi:hypothetical protein
MGEKVPAGALTYTVLESKWRSQLGTAPASRLPERNFLLVRLQVTNSSGTDQTVPGMSLENSSGDIFPEVTDGTGVDRWFGLVRRIAPAMTDDGWLLFDVPTNSYQLRIAVPDSEGNERIYTVKLPLSLEE